MKPRKFISEKGSTVTVSGKFHGITAISFDWFEEGACVEMHPFFNFDYAEPAIVASCDCCGSVKIPLKEVFE